MTALARVTRTVTLLLALPAAAFACSCLPPPPPLEARAEAAAVFVGTVVESRRFDDRHQLIELEIHEVFKGPASATVRVVTGLGQGDCGINFQRGGRYLVYADGNEESLSAHLCSRTKLLFDDRHEEELQVLRGPGAADA